MSEPTETAERYIAAWNEQDPVRRHHLLEEFWSADASYADPLMRGAGHDAIGALIKAVQARFPEFQFTLDGAVQGYAEHIRFSWGLGPAGQDAVIKGTDFVTMRDGRIQSVVGFLDQVPQAA
jgi:hypothetical protein